MVYKLSRVDSFYAPGTKLRFEKVQTAAKCKRNQSLTDVGKTYIQ